MLSFIFGSFLFGPIITILVCSIVLYKTGFIHISLPTFKIPNPFKCFSGARKGSDKGGTPMIFAKKTCKRCGADYLYLIGEEASAQSIHNFSYKNELREIISLDDMCPTCVDEFTTVLNSVEIRNGKVILSNQAAELAKLIKNIN